jgi:hypothetical protein
LAYAGPTRLFSALALVLAVTASLAAAPLALGALPPTKSPSTRYASPGGSNSDLNDCKDSENPCTLDRAIAAANEGDEVVLRSGNYTQASGWDITERLDVHGIPGQPRPVLSASGPGSVETLQITANGTHVWYLQLENTSPSYGFALALTASGALVEDVFAHTAGGSATTCAINGSSDTVRNTVCWQSGAGTGSTAMYLHGGGPHSLRNVTAINDSSANQSAALAQYSGCPCGLATTVVNSIVRGGQVDVRAESGGTGAVTVTLSYSNYDPERQFVDMNGLVTSAGHNQTALPLFANAAAGDFHQLASSPTVDAGQTDDANNGTQDFELDARTLGAATDIGADEFVPPGTPPGGGGGGADTVAPAFLALTQANSVWALDRTGPSEPSATRKVKRGTQFDYTLSENARVIFKIERALPGRRVGGRCRKARRSNRRKRRCTRWVLFGSFAQQGFVGGNVKTWSGKIGKRKVRPGRHRVTFLATDGAGNASGPKSLRFRVVRP